MAFKKHVDGPVTSSRNRMWRIPGDSSAPLSGRSDPIFGFPKDASPLRLQPRLYRGG